MGKPVGRPLAYSNARELQALVDDYFEDRDHVERPYTITGLALALDMDRRRLLEYEGRAEFHNVIKKAKERVRLSVEERIMSGQQAAGPIFWLKNNAGWVDKQEVTHSGGLTIGVEDALASARKAAEQEALESDSGELIEQDPAKSLISDRH